MPFLGSRGYAHSLARGSIVFKAGNTASLCFSPMVTYSSADSSPPSPPLLLRALVITFGVPG